MKKKFLFGWLGFALTIALILSGCGDSSPDVLIGPNAGNGGITNGGGSGNDGGIGLEPPRDPGGHGGGIGNPVIPDPDHGGGDDDDDDDDDDGGAFNFLAPPSFQEEIRSLSNPTFVQSALVNNYQDTHFFVVDGFSLSNNQGRLHAIVEGSDGKSKFVEVKARSGNNELDSPFGLITSVTNDTFYISTGFDHGIGNGDIVQVSNIEVTQSGASHTAQADFKVITGNGSLINPAFMTLLGNNIYWTQYSSTSAGGGIYRTNISGNGPVETVVSGLNFPIGLAYGNGRLLVAEASTIGGTGRVLALETPNLLNVSPSDLTEITSDNPFLRPFAIAFDPLNGFLITDGFAVEVATSGGVAYPEPNSPGLGTLQFLDSSKNKAVAVSTGLNRPAHLDTLSLSDGKVRVLFSESAPATGRLLRREFSRNDLSKKAPNVLATGLHNPLGVHTIPGFYISAVDYNTGVSNGSVHGYY